MVVGAIRPSQRDWTACLKTVLGQHACPCMPTAAQQRGVWGAVGCGGGAHLQHAHEVGLELVQVVVQLVRMLCEQRLQVGRHHHLALMGRLLCQRLNALLHAGNGFDDVVGAALCVVCRARHSRLNVLHGGSGQAPKLYMGTWLGPQPAWHHTWHYKCKNTQH